jgi:hypothetical protein
LAYRLNLDEKPTWTGRAIVFIMRNKAFTLYRGKGGRLLWEIFRRMSKCQRCGLARSAPAAAPVRSGGLLNRQGDEKRTAAGQFGNVLDADDVQLGLRVKKCCMIKA